jgi:hypothetical protein
MESNVIQDPIMQEPSNRFDWLSIGQLVVGLISCLICFILAGVLFVMGISSLNQPSIYGLGSTVLSLLSVLVAAVGILNIPSVILVIRHLGGKTPLVQSRLNSLRLANYALLALPLILISGHFISQSSSAWLFLPLLNVLALLIPIWWIMEIGRHRLPSGSPQRSWGLVSISVTIIPVLTLLLELLVMVVMVLVIFLILSSQPVWAERLRQLSIQANQAEFDVNFLETFLQNLASNPLVITAVFVTIGGLMPLIEELLKTLGLWILRKRILTPAEGFSAGLIGGAGFALIESASLIAETGGANWLQLVLLRIATSLLHITLSGFVGWGLASAWTQKRNGRFFFSLLIAAGVHGLWNSLAILLIILPSLSGTGLLAGLFQGGMVVGLAVMASILILLAASLIAMNRHLHKEGQETVPPPPDGLPAG